MKVIIIGGRGTAVIIAEQIYDAINRYHEDIELLGFAFDDETMGDTINGFPLLCKTYDAYAKYGRFDDVKFIYSLYRPDLMRVRVDLLKKFNIPDEKMFSFIHPTATILRSVKYGPGNVFLANVVANSNVVIGKNNTFNVGGLIGHDTKIGDYNFVAAQVCLGSNLQISNGNFIGLNSSIRNFLEIGDFNIIGMQSNVTKNIASDDVLFGNPAVSKGKLNNAAR